MRISKPFGRSRTIIIDENEVSQIKNSSLFQGGVINMSYERIECENGEGIWGSRSNDNSRYSPILEAIYQKLINKPVQTTKEQPELHYFSKANDFIDRYFKESPLGVKTAILSFANDLDVKG